FHVTGVQTCALPISQCTNSRHFVNQSLTRQTRGFAESSDTGYILRARSPVPFVTAAGQDWLERRTFLYEKCSDALRSMDLVCRQIGRASWRERVVFW